jgi:hypothetical protein
VRNDKESFSGQTKDVPASLTVACSESAIETHRELRTVRGILGRCLADGCIRHMATLMALFLRYTKAC